MRMWQLWVEFDNKVEYKVDWLHFTFYYLFYIINQPKLRINKLLSLKIINVKQTNIIILYFVFNWLFDYFQRRNQKTYKTVN